MEKQKRIGILCASDTELEPFLKRIQSPQITEKAMLKFYCGRIGQADVVAVYSGVCKVNAARELRPIAGGVTERLEFKWVKDGKHIEYEYITQSQVHL